MGYYEDEYEWGDNEDTPVEGAQEPPPDNPPVGLRSYSSFWEGPSPAPSRAGPSSAQADTPTSRTPPDSGSTQKVSKDVNTSLSVALLLLPWVFDILSSCHYASFSGSDTAPAQAEP